MQTDLNAELDWSLSAENSSIKEFAQKFMDETPDLIERYNVDTFAAFQFGDDGWSPGKIFSVDFPQAAKPIGSEAGQIFGSISKARSERNRERRRVQIADILARVSPDSLVPAAAARDARCTDLNGLFKRISSSKKESLQIYVVITDGHETCMKALKPVNDPASPVALVVALLPEKSRISDDSPKYEQFDRRAAEISKAAPWAVIIPPFGDISAAVGEAVEKAQ